MAWPLAVVVMLAMSLVIGWNKCWMSLVIGWNTHWVSLESGQKTAPSSCEIGVGSGMLKPAVGAGAVVLVVLWSRLPCCSSVGASLFVSFCRVSGCEVLAEFVVYGGHMPGIASSGPEGCIECGCFIHGGWSASGIVCGSFGCVD